MCRLKGQMNPLKLSDLASRRIAAKANEDAAIRARREIDAQIIAEMGSVEEGTLTHETNGLSIKVSYSQSRKVVNDVELRANWANLTELQQKCFRWKSEIDVKALRILEAANPLLNNAMLRYIETKAAAPTVKIESLVIESEGGEA